MKDFSLLVLIFIYLYFTIHIYIYNIYERSKIVSGLGNKEIVPVFVYANLTFICVCNLLNL
jgi:hypothetical protein